MNKKKNLDHQKNLLKHVYNLPQEKLNQMTPKEITELLAKKEQDRINNSQNPNKFWILDSLPAPLHYQTKTSSKYGILIVVMLFVVLLGFLGVFFWLAL